MGPIRLLAERNPDFRFIRYLSPPPITELHSWAIGGGGSRTSLSTIALAQSNPESTIGRNGYSVNLAGFHLRSDNTYIPVIDLYFPSYPCIATLVSFGLTSTPGYDFAHYWSYPDYGTYSTIEADGSIPQFSGGAFQIEEGDLLFRDAYLRTGGFLETIPDLNTVQNRVIQKSFLIPDFNVNPGVIVSKDGNEITHTYELREGESGSSYLAKFYFIDQWGIVSSNPLAGGWHLSIAPGEDEQSSSISDEHGTLFTAANNVADQATETSAGVQITRHEINNAGQYVGFKLQSIFNVKNPTLLQHKGTHGLFVFAQDRTSKIWQLWHSDTYGEAFEKMADSPMNGDYKGVVTCAVDNGLAICGLKKGTAEIWFARSWDGVEYDDIEGGTGDGNKLKLVGSKTGAKTVSMTGEETSGGSRLVVVVNGTPFKFSDDFGDEWENAQ